MYDVPEDLTGGNGSRGSVKKLLKRQQKRRVQNILKL
jgi:hypothetical protein